MADLEQQDVMNSIARGVMLGKLGFDVTHCIEEDRFYVYRNGVWRRIYENELLKEITDKFSFINKYTISKRRQVLDNLKVLVGKRLNEFNLTERLNFADGEFDPRTGILHEHTKESYITTIMSYPYDYSSTCPIWERALDEILEGERDKISLLQEFFGYCLIPDTKQKKAMLLLGESNSGKSTILFILRAMMGEQNCSSVPLKYISHPQYTPMMINKLVNIDADVSKDAQSYEAEFKIITSGEPISCNQKFVETFEFVPKCRIVLAANIFPKITDHSSAFYNRLILIPCDRVFTEKEQDKELVGKIKQELPGVFNWSLRGLRRLLERGRFEQHDFMREAVKELEDENNPVNLFIDEHVEISMGSLLEKGELFDKYKEWCLSTKNFNLSLARFSQCIYKRFHKETPRQTSIHGKRVWRNIKYVNYKDTTPQQEVDWKE